ncbi:unnamed protein product [Brassica oleracea]|uniref:fructose-bisphosphate aldolase n=2 Tax=Brassica oleracea TaxID=3712 RepID=A0A0D3AXE4_BRAOL|nr:unnamed protein product [Brassica oleracea]
MPLTSAHPDILADESTGTIGKRLASINVMKFESNRRALRELLFTAHGALPCLSGVILFEETLYEKSSDRRKEKYYQVSKSTRTCKLFISNIPFIKYLTRIHAMIVHLLSNSSSFGNVL